MLQRTYRSMGFWAYRSCCIQAVQNVRKCDIPTMESYISFDGDDVWKSKRVRFNKVNIKDEDKILINKVVDKFSEYSATDLVTLTQHQTPWIDAFSLGKTTKFP